MSEETVPVSCAIRVDLRPEPPPAGHVFPELSVPDSSTGAAKGRICFVSHELVGVLNNGGVGTAQTSIAKVLAASGHDVTILLLKHPGRPLTDEIVSYYAGLGITVAQEREFFDLEFYGQDRVREPYGVYEWLKQQQFDVVHGPELFGFLYFAMIAKRLGLAFANTLFVIGTHAPTEWLAELNHMSLAEPNHLIASFMERASVALADIAWSPSRHLLDWMRASAWPVGDNSRFQRLAYLPYDGMPRTGPAPQAPVGELVFFGRLQRRKGIELFCDAIDLLQPAIAALDRPFKVTFLGDNHLATFGIPKDFHEKRAARWNHDWAQIEDMATPDALAYLRAPGRVAVVPSLSDNSPNTIHECLLYGIPFAASNVGGIPEMVAERDHQRVLFSTRPDDCARILARLIAAPAQSVTPAFDVDEVNHSWVRWHDHAVAAARAARAAERRAADALPKITVVVCGSNRPHLLAQAMRSLDRQSYRNFDVVVADGDDRNQGAREGTGDHLFFLSDSDVLVPHALEMFATAAARSGADILTSALMNAPSDEEPTERTPVTARSIFLGGGLAMAGFWNVNSFGGASFLIRRAAFQTLGGFDTIPGPGHEHVALFIRAELTGLSLYSIPEPLAWTRPAAVQDHYPGNRLQLRPLHEQAPPYLRLTLLNAQDTGRELIEARRAHDETKRMRDHYLMAAVSLSQERDQLKGKVAALEKAVAATSQVNDMLMEKLTSGLTGA